MNAEKVPAAQITEKVEERPVTLYFSYANANEFEDIDTAENEEAAAPAISEERPEASAKMAETRSEESVKLNDKELTGVSVLEQIYLSEIGAEQTEDISEQQEEDTTVQHEENTTVQQEEDTTVQQEEDTTVQPAEETNAQQEERYTEAEKRMIARVVYAEARGECFDGQVAVAQVVINRYESGKFGASVKRIVYGKHQFAVGKRYSKACMDAVEYAINNMPYPKNMYFFQVSKRKHWRNFVYYNRIGNHSFYCLKKKPH